MKDTNVSFLDQQFGGRRMNKGMVMAAILMVLGGCGPGENAQPGPAPENQSPDTDAGQASEGETGVSAGSLVSPVEPPSGDSGSGPAATTSLKPRIPVFNATCGNGLEVHANEGGPVFIDGEEASLKKFNDNYFEASLGGNTISISFNPDESLSLSFTGPNRTNGICSLK